MFARYKTNGMSACHCFGSRKRARCTRCHKVTGEVAVPFKVPGFSVVDKTVFPSPLSVLAQTHAG